MQYKRSPYRNPLPNELYRQELEYAGKFTGLDSPDKAIDFLEDRLAHISDHIGLGVRHPSEFSPCVEALPESAMLNTFYITVLMRYLKKKDGMPKLNQHLTDFDTPEGNQVDRFLAEIFNIK